MDLPRPERFPISSVRIGRVRRDALRLLLDVRTSARGSVSGRAVDATDPIERVWLSSWSQRHWARGRVGERRHELSVLSTERRFVSCARAAAGGSRPRRRGAGHTDRRDRHSERRPGGWCGAARSSRRGTSPSRSRPCDRRAARDAWASRPCRSLEGRQVAAVERCPAATPFAAQNGRENRRHVLRRSMRGSTLGDFGASSNRPPRRTGTARPVHNRRT